MEGKEHVISFLKNCIAYADASIGRKNKRGETDDISKWQAYRDYTAHALMEVEAGNWTGGFHLSNQNCTSMKSVPLIWIMSHQSRSQWLTNLVGPRPFGPHWNQIKSRNAQPRTIYLIIDCLKFTTFGYCFSFSRPK